MRKSESHLENRALRPAPKSWPTGAGDAEVAVTDALNVVITGAGKVTYSGNPSAIKKQITGAGSVRHKDKG